MSHNTCEWYLNNFVLKGGNNTSTRHIVISPGESTIFYKYKENGSPAYKVDRIFGRKDKLSKNDFTAPPKEDRSKCNSVPNFLKRFVIIIRKLTQLVGCLSLTAVAILLHLFIGLLHHSIYQFLCQCFVGLAPTPIGNDSSK